MTIEKKKSSFKVNPRATANPLSAWLFLWTFKLFRIGYRRDFDRSDLTEPLSEHESSNLGNLIEREWNEEVSRAKTSGDKLPSLWKAMIKIFGWKMFLLGVGLEVADVTIKLGQPIFLAKLLNYFTSDSTMTFEEAKLYATGVAISVCLHQVFLHPFVLALSHMGLKMRVALSTLVFRKLLRITSSANMGVTCGHLVNILSNDVGRFDNAPQFLPDLFFGIFIALVVSYLMWYEAGVAALVGLAVLILFCPLQIFILAINSTTLRERTTLKTDKRVQLMNEIIAGIQAIKMYGWEKPFATLVENVRNKEVRVIRTKSFVVGILFACSLFLTKVALFVSVTYHALQGNTVTAERVFVLALYYNILQDNITFYVPTALRKWAECYVSVKRIRDFLMTEESTSAINMSNLPSVKPATQELILWNVSAKWFDTLEENTLENLNVTINKRSLVAIIGEVGSGKSSVLQLILREMPRTVGTISVKGSSSYASQEAWLFPGTVSENILFGLPMDIQRYNEVVRVCALIDDFQQLPQGDKTLIGERGVCLSGGQRARVNLARAVYREADIYLLDDPLSAVDAHVGRHIFDQCICEFLSEKIVVLVTHHLEYLVDVEHIIVMKGGRISAQGSYSELRAVGYDLAHLKEENEDGGRKEQIQRKPSVRSDANVSELKEEEEMTGTGKVDWKVYYSYFRASTNIPQFFFLVFLLIFSQCLASGSEYWTAYWVDLEEHLHFAHATETLYELPLLGHMNREKSLWVYGSLIILFVTFIIIRTLTFFYFCSQASKRLHDQMFRAVSNATMNFFNNNPSGRVLNRFSRDMGLVDETLPDTFLEFIQTLLKMFGVIVVVALVNWWLIIPFLFILVLFVFMRQYFVATSRSLKRLEGLTRSPMYTLANSALQGLPTIRSTQATHHLQRDFDQLQNTNSSASYFTCAVGCAMSFWLDLICAIYVVFVTYSVLYLGDFDGGEAGLTITQSCTLIFMCQWAMRRSADLENCMTSVERVLEFQKVDSEEGMLETLPDHSLPPGWPRNGDVMFKGVSMCYNSSDPPVLKDLNFAVSRGEKIGVVGRTGAGKSSLVNALFRLHPVEGQITIDGVDTSYIGLHDLRSNISIIPQEPVLFTGTLRSNLDPFHGYDDCDLWSALEDVELKSLVEETPGQLSSEVTEGGSNLSVGQRQLVCLARAILRRNVILVLDEATANMDPRTDQLIQTTLRRKLTACTVFTIAHRLHSVMDADRILVMDSGRVAEFGPPVELLQDPGSLLSALVERTGPVESKALRAMAEMQAAKSAALRDGTGHLPP